MGSIWWIYKDLRFHGNIFFTFRSKRVIQDTVLLGYCLLLAEDDKAFQPAFILHYTSYNVKLRLFYSAFFTG